MKHTELRQFLRDANRARLSPIEKDVFQYYYSKAARVGVWHCPDAETAEEIFRSRSGVAEARLALIDRGWISEEGKYNVRIIKKFVGNATNETEKFVGNATKTGVDFVGNATNGLNPVGDATSEPESCRKCDNLVGNATKDGENLVGNATDYIEKGNFKEIIKGNKEESEAEEEVTAARACANGSPSSSSSSNPPVDTDIPPCGDKDEPKPEKLLDERPKKAPEEWIEKYRRKDLDTDAWHGHLQTEFEVLPILMLWEGMLIWCEENHKVPNRPRFLRWIWDELRQDPEKFNREALAKNESNRKRTSKQDRDAYALNEHRHFTELRERSRQRRRAGELPGGDQSDRR